MPVVTGVREYAEIDYIRWKYDKLDDPWPSGIRHRSPVGFKLQGERWLHDYDYKYGQYTIYGEESI